MFLNYVNMSLFLMDNLNICILLRLNFVPMLFQERSERLGHQIFRMIYLIHKGGHADCPSTSLSKTLNAKFPNHHY